MDSEFRGEIRHRAGAQGPCMNGAPGVIRAEILHLSAIGIVDATVETPFFYPSLKFRKRNLAQQRDRIVMELAPSNRIEVPKQRNGFRVPTPPEISREGPETLPDWCNEPVKHSGFADHGSNLRCCLGQQMYFDLIK